jgi:iron complex outermembrane recepter protein
MRNSRHVTRRVCIFVSCALAASTAALAGNAEYRLNIPEQPLSTALIDVARQSGLQVAGLTDVATSRSQVGPLQGNYSIQDAMELLLRASGLSFKMVDAQTVAVYRPTNVRWQASEESRLATQSGSGPTRLAQAAVPAAPPPASADNAVTAEVVVTGTHIQQTGMSTPTPVTVLSADELQQTKPGTIIEALNTVPQFVNNSTPGNGVNFSTNSGQSFLNMRGLGINRTLTLLDGRRVVPSSRLGATDISLIPQALVSRVEVVTGGASAVYGSDAVAGVANFILDTKFQGLDLRGLGGITGRGDNSTFGGSATFGTSLGERLHVIGSAEFYSSKAVENLRNRDWFGTGGIVTNPQWIANGTGPRLLTLKDVTSTRYTEGGLINQPGSALDRLMFLPDGTATPFVAGPIAAIGTGTFSQSGGIGFHRLLDGGAGAGGLYPNLERQTAFMHADFELTDNVSLFAEVMYGHSVTNYNQGGGAMFAQWQLTIYQENPFLAENIRQTMIEEGLASIGLSRMASKADLGRSRNQTSNSLFSPTIGFKADIGGWKINGDYQDGKNQSNSFLINYIRSDRLAYAVDAVRDPVSGAIVCNITLYQANTGCVPINLLGAGRASPQAIDYILNDKLGFATTKQRFGEITASKEISKGWGAGPVSLAFGASTRRQSLSQYAVPEDGKTFVPFDDPTQGIRGVPPGFAGNPFLFVFSSFPTIGGSYSVHEGFAETLLPLMANKPGIEQLNLSLAGRFADYSGSGGVWAWKGGLDWQVIPSVRLRGTVSRDTRAANLAERFDSQGGGVVVRDPVFNNSNVTLSQFSTGNPEVDPEKATTYTAGAVFQPSFVPGLQLSLDWYSIENKSAIAQLGAQAIVDNCFAGSAGSCALITRDPITNSLVFVQNKYLNVNKVAVEGFDAEADYRREVTWFGGAEEQVSLRFIGSYLMTNSIGQDTGNATGSGQGALGATNYSGQVGNGFSVPRFQGVAHLAYSRGGLRAALEERFIGEGKVDHAYVSGRDIDDNSVGSAAYTDFDLSYTFDSTRADTLTVYGHITNAFDRAPPIVPGFSDLNGASQYNQAVYDVLGRRFTLGVKMRF